MSSALPPTTQTTSLMDGCFSLARKLLCAGFAAMAASACHPPQADNRPVGDSSPSSANQVQAAPEGVRLALLEPTGVSDASGVEGVLQLDGDCVSIGSGGESTGKMIPAFTGSNVRWNPQNNAIDIAGRQIAVGQKVLLTGSLSTRPDLLVWEQKPSCSADEVGTIFVTGAINSIP